MANVFIQVIAGNEIHTLTLKDVEVMEIKRGFWESIGYARNLIKFEKNAEITFQCKAISRNPRIKETDITSLAGHALKEAYDKGQEIEIPSLGITIQKDNEENVESDSD